MTIRNILFCSFGVSLVGVVIGNLYESKSIQFLLLFTIILNILFLVHYYKKNVVVSWISDVVTLLIVSYTIYFITYPIDHALNYVDKYSDEKIFATSTLYAMSNLILLIGLYFGNKLGKKTDLELNYLKVKFDLGMPSMLILFLGIILMFYDQYRLGGFDVIGISNRLDNFAAQRMSGSSSIALPWHNFIEAGLIGLALSVERNRDVKKILAIMITLSIFFFLGLGSRTMILLTCLPAIAVLIDRKFIRINKYNSIVIITIIFLSISPLFTNYRNYLISDVSFSELPKNAWAWSNGETGTSFQISVDVTSIQNWGEADPTYFTSFLYLFPSAIYEILRGEVKPLNLGDWYVMYFYPYFYASGGGFGFSPIAQAWMNGGLISLVVVFFTIGLLFSYMNRTTLFKYLLLALVIWLQRGAFNSVISEFIYTSVLLLLIFLASKILRVIKMNI